ncbi:Uu.00g087790.m01.CDS01 [Anthostomella pinea]|uniref:Uu.00g087790.m01.CDS01 n=1 Tax=Anthostomella pinea TaxID=933095 RepID=A0AAI8YK57_9PEZI|nr:Uu.00g087790.m01.CDS01 [Anthostomella pinea]
MDYLRYMPLFVKSLLLKVLNFFEPPPKVKVDVDLSSDGLEDLEQEYHHTAPLTDTDDEPDDDEPMYDDEYDEEMGYESEEREDIQARVPRTNIRLNGDNIKVIEALFSLPGSRSSDLDWVQFTQLMTRLGFGVRMRGGSATTFTPYPGAFVPFAQMGAIVFHMPHGKSRGSPKCKASTARKWGARLRERYGWTADMFLEN